MNANKRKYVFFIRVHLRSFAAALLFSLSALPPTSDAQVHPLAPISTDASGAQEFDNAAALNISQAAIGTRLENYRFTNSKGEAVSLSDFSGKPLVISLIYSNCYHTCPMTTQHLAKAVGSARAVLGATSFTVLTIGFDTRNDTPRAMADFARQQKIALIDWHFLSADEASMARLMKDLGFIYKSSPKGFDHLIQASVVDGEGKLYRQVYGELFETPWLVEPLKQLHYGKRVDDSAWDEMVKKVQLFCTTYDPATGRYRFDYSLFVGMAIGFMIIAGALIFVVRSARRQRPT